jgi:tryptophan synthase beta chain
MKSKFHPDKNGYFGQFGGAFIPELLHPNVKELADNYIQIIASEEFQTEYKSLLKEYVGRPTPLYLAQRLSDKYGAHIYLKREDLCHTWYCREGSQNILLDGMHITIRNA